MVNKMKRQVTFPSFSTGILEVIIFSSVFLVTGSIGLDSGLSSMILPMIIFSGVMMTSMVLTGVYRSDISRSIVQLYQRTAVGYIIAGAGMVLLAVLTTSEYFDLRFSGFVLLFSFFVVSTIRPVIVDSISTAEGDRRAP